MQAKGNTITFQLTAPMIDLINIVKQTPVYEHAPHKIDDMIDALITATESCIAGNLSIDDDHEIIIKRVLSDELFLVINDEDDYNRTYDLIRESILHFSDLLSKYNLLDRDVVVYGVCSVNMIVYVKTRS